METKKYTQYGRFTILVLLPMALLFLGWWMKYRFSEDLYMMLPLYISIALIILLLLFYKLTITVNEKNLSFKMGIGLIHKSFPISDIESCKPVTNYFLTGFGIRLIRNGWLYNVSGFKVIELKFHSKKSVIRIGTDCPDEICTVIQEIKGISFPKEKTAEVESQRKFLRSRMVILLVILALFAGFIISVRQEKKVIIDNNSIKIKGLYGVNIPFNDITEIDTLSILPSIRRKTNGYADGNTMVGYFKMSDNSKAKLFIKTRNSPYLMIKSKHTVPVYISFEDRHKTVKLFEDLKKRR